MYPTIAPTLRERYANGVRRGTYSSPKPPQTVKLIKVRWMMKNGCYSSN